MRQQYVSRKSLIDGMCRLAVQSWMLLLPFWIMPPVVDALADRGDQPQRPIGLDEAMALALDADSELRHLRLDHELDAARFRVGLREFFPSLSLSYSGMDAVTEAEPDSRSRRLTFGVEQLVYGGNRRVVSRRLRRKELEIEELEILAAAERVSVATMDLVVDYLRNKRQTAIYEQTLALTSAQHAIALREYELGSMSELQLLEIDLALRNLDLELQRLRVEKQRSLLRFRRHIRIEEEVFPAGGIDIDYRGSIGPGEVETLRMQMPTQNTQVLRSEAELRSAREQARRARMMWLPDIRLSAELSSAAEQFPLTEHGVSLGLTFDFSLPLLPGESTLTAGERSTGERTRGTSASVRPGDNIDALYNRATADVALSRSETRRDELLYQLGNDISELAIDLRFRRAAVDSLQARLAAEERRAAVAELRHALGEITRLTLVETELARTRIAAEMVDAVVAIFRTELTLLQKTGAGTAPNLFRRVITNTSREA